jgi:hypothetical protein
LLQVLDVSTTLLFLSLGIEEANPLVRCFMQVTHGGLSGLLATKLLAVPLIWYCVSYKRDALLARVNRGYAFLIVWNLVASAAGILSH